MWHREKPDPRSVSDDNVSPVWPKRGGPGDIRIINQNEPQREETSTKATERTADAWEEGAATRLADSERGGSYWISSINWRDQPDSGGGWIHFVAKLVSLRA